MASSSNCQQEAKFVNGSSFLSLISFTTRFFSHNHSYYFLCICSWIFPGALFSGHLKQTGLLKIQYNL